MLKELSQGTDDKNLPTDKFQDISTAINQLDQDLATYVTDYTANLALESQSFKSIANPESNYQSFFDVLKNVNTLSTTSETGAKFGLGRRCLFRPRSRAAAPRIGTGFCLGNTRHPFGRCRQQRRPTPHHDARRGIGGRFDLSGDGPPRYPSRRSGSRIA